MEKNKKYPFNKIWNIVPPIGTVNHASKGLHQIGNGKFTSASKEFMTSGLHFAYAAIIAFWTTGGIISGEWNPKEQINYIQGRNYQHEILMDKKEKLVEYVDSDNDGKLSFRENYKLTQLMEIEDSFETSFKSKMDIPRTRYEKIPEEYPYRITDKDWARAYENMQKEKQSSNSKSIDSKLE